MVKRPPLYWYEQMRRHLLAVRDISARAVKVFHAGDPEALGIEMSMLCEALGDLAEASTAFEKATKEQEKG